MKALKTILGIVVALVAIFLIMGLLAPNDNHIERTVVIDAPIDLVREQVSTFAAIHEWSPWVEKDPNAKFEYEGEDGTPGAIYKWEGNENVGKGKQKLVSVTPNRVETELIFYMPFGEAKSMANIELEETEDGTLVKWTYDDHADYPMNAMNLTFDMDEMLGPDYQKGLDNLKARVDSIKASKKEFNGFVINEEQLTPRTYIGIHDTIGFGEMQPFLDKNFSNSANAVEKAGLEMVGMPSAVYYEWNEETQEADLIAAVPVKDGSIDGFVGETVDGRALVIEYKGSYDGLMKAHEAMDAYMKWHKIEYRGPVIEEYVTDPETEADPNNWVTKVIYPVKS